MLLLPPCYVTAFFPVFIASKSAVYCPLLLKLLDLALNARMVKLVDTLDLGSSAFGVGVQVPLRAPFCKVLEPIFFKKWGERVFFALSPHLYPLLSSMVVDFYPTFSTFDPVD